MSQCDPISKTHHITHFSFLNLLDLEENITTIIVGNFI